ncbi:hypothetical protein [Phenylobacterium immobile]|uniref:hypothetical protein n=1 Tax=Phenylobacterium immobile TaxID=21 RepID=UPI000A913365|nr:hypothetical protein [Phenylobacterium immobile]
MSYTSADASLMRSPLPRHASRRRRRGALAAMLALAIGGGLLGYLSHLEATGDDPFGSITYVAAL